MDIKKHRTFLTYLTNKYTLKCLDVELLLTVVSKMLQYVDDNILQIMYVDLYDDVYNYSLEIMKNDYLDSDILENIYNLSKEESNKLLKIYLKMGQSYIYKYVMPKRSYYKNHIRNNSINYTKIDKQLNTLINIVQPEQRTDEWYIFRNSTLTASNIYKIFVSEYSQTQLILEKCEPLNINKFKVTNTNSPMHWGQKYEPVSILYYEHIYKTTVTEFGCIPHRDHSFIAASPDGIVCDQSSNLYGRMLEIKNVVSREITGIPKMEYWIQMQLQMEVCDLNECDFLETKFLQYDTEEEYINDNTIEYKGIILQYLKDESPHYIYAPFMLNDLHSTEYKEWESKVMEKNKDLQLITRIYWKLVKISCVLVLRNKLWFKNVLPMIDVFWKNLVDERESGKYKERIKKKRKLSLDDAKSRSDFPTGGCLINTNLFNKEDNVENVIISVNTEVIL
tara:strand:+ start:4117 stop:5466 length:1350 start_codon:yes stop_codon:yes gene_type:complete